MYKDLQATVALAISAVVCGDADALAEHDLASLSKLYSELRQGLVITDAGLLISVWYQFNDLPYIIEDDFTYEQLKQVLTSEGLWCISDGEYQEKLVNELDWAPIKVKDICTMLCECRCNNMETWFANCIEYSEEK